MAYCLLEIQRHICFPKSTRSCRWCLCVKPAWTTSIRVAAPETRSIREGGFLPPGLSSTRPALCGVTRTQKHERAYISMRLQVFQPWMCSNTLMYEFNSITLSKSFPHLDLEDPLFSCYFFVFISSGSQGHWLMTSLCAEITFLYPFWVVTWRRVHAQSTSSPIVN